MAKLPDGRRVLVQEVDRPAVPLPRQLARPHRELPAHDVRGAVGAVRGEPHDRARAQAAADPARRPRAELLDLDGAHGRLEPRRTSTRRSRPASTRCGARCTAAPTRPCVEMLESIRDQRRRRRAGTSSGPRTPTTRSGCRASATASTRTTTRGPGSSRTPPTGCSPSSTSKDALFDIALRARGGRAHRRLLHREEALPERRLLLGPHLPGDGLPHQHVPGAVRDRPPARLDRALEGGDENPKTKIGRPRQIYTGPTERKYVAIDQR